MILNTNFNDIGFETFAAVQYIMQALADTAIAEQTNS
jgi:hypothetical protein